MEQGEGPLNLLPEELLLLILEYLEGESVLIASQVCLLWHRLFSSMRITAGTL